MFFPDLREPNEPEQQVGNALPSDRGGRNHGHCTRGVVVVPVELRVETLLHHLCRSVQLAESGEPLPLPLQLQLPLQLHDENVSFAVKTRGSETSGSFLHNVTNTAIIH